MKPEFNSLQNSQSDCPPYLIQRCKQGEYDAQLQVYKLYYRPVFNICLQIVNDQAVAEALMQESILLAFENINAYNGDIRFSLWLNKFIKDALKHGYVAAN